LCKDTKKKRNTKCVKANRLLNRLAKNLIFLIKFTNLFVFLHHIDVMKLFQHTRYLISALRALFDNASDYIWFLRKTNLSVEASAILVSY